MLLGFLVAWVPLATLVAQSATPPASGSKAKESQDKEIDAWTRKLHLTGPDARLQREEAVVNLISMNDPRAHEPLIRALDRASDGGPDQRGVARLILTELRRSLANHRHPVFGVGDSRNSMRRAYMRPLVQLYGALVEGEPHPLQEAAGQCLRKLPKDERIAGAELLLGTPDMTLRQATLLALGDSWDLGVAPFLAGYLEDPALVLAAIRGLKRLTFEDLRTTAEYEAWWAANKGRTYMDIAIEAAREADRRVHSERQRIARHLRRAYAEIVAILVTSKRPDRWKKIEGYIFAPTLGVMRTCLLQLRDRLRDGIELAGGAEAGDRLSLWAALHKELARPGQPVGDYALLLEVTSHLIAPTEARERRKQEDLLRKALDHGSVEVVLAGLRGLRQFPSADNRLAVVQLAERIHSGDANIIKNGGNTGNSGNSGNTNSGNSGDSGTGNRGNGNSGTGNRGNSGDDGNTRRIGDVGSSGGDKSRLLLAEALATLKSAGWTAPLPADKDYVQWQKVLGKLLLDNELDAILRQEVVKALAKPDRNNGHPSEVQLQLSILAGRPSEDLSLRQAALLELPQVITDAESADEYVKFLVNLLQDKEEEVRREAASQLKRLPYDRDRANEKRAAWQKLLLENLTIGDLLGSETSDKVFAVLVDRLVGLAKENPAHASAVFLRLSDALGQIYKEGKPETAFKIPVLKQGIIDYATAKDRHAVEWIRACEALIAVQDRKSALAILGARNPNLDPEKPEVRTRYQKMRVDLALLAPGSESAVGNGAGRARGWSRLPWGTKARRAEATEVIAALEALAREQPVPVELSRPQVRLLWLRCLAGTNEHKKLVQRAEPWLAGNDHVFRGSDRVNATLLLVLAHLQSGQPEQAMRWISNLGLGPGAAVTANDLPDDEGGLARVERVADLLLASARKTPGAGAGMLDAARTLARHAATNTEPEDLAYLRRKLLDLEARGLRADATTKSGLRGQLDRLFGPDGARAPAALKARVERLRKDLGGG